MITIVPNYLFIDTLFKQRHKIYVKKIERLTNKNIAQK